MLLKGKSAIVAGIGPGMGRAVSIALAKHGADVMMMARKKETIERVSLEIEALGRKAPYYLGDVTNRRDCDATAEAAVQVLGSVDVLVYNAFYQGELKSLIDVNLDDWRRVLDVNLFGSINMVRAVVPHMEKQGDGRIIMINSLQGLKMVPGGFGCYSSSKAALTAVTRTLAHELGSKGIRVNGIHPGLIMGEAIRAYFRSLAEQENCRFEDIYERFAAEAALGYIPDSEEMAGTAVFLASDLARPITGQSIVTDGGTFFH